MWIWNVLLYDCQMYELASLWKKCCNSIWKNKDMKKQKYSILIVLINAQLHSSIDFRSSVFWI